MKNNTNLASILFSVSVFASQLASADTTTYTYIYDDLGRLKSAKTSDVKGHEYEYDAADNRTKKIALYSPIMIDTRTIKSTLSNGTAKYKLKPDGTIEVTKTTSMIYAGQTFYADQTIIEGRWLEQGYSASNFNIDASLQSFPGSSNCTTGTYYSNLPAHYEASWTMSAATGYSVRTCSISIKIRANDSPTVLGSAVISLRAGPGA